MSSGVMVGLKRGSGDENNNMHKNPMQMEEVVFCWRVLLSGEFEDLGIHS